MDDDDASVGRVEEARLREARFEADTAVESVGDGRYRGTVTDRWLVLGGSAPNGGYLMSIAARAMSQRSGRPDPVTVTAHFLRPPVVGEVDITTEVVKEGRRFATLQASMHQEGRETVRLLGAFGDLPSFAGPSRDDRTALGLPPREEMVDANAAADERGDFAPPILRRFDVLVPPDTMGWTVGEPTGRGEMSGYMRFAGGEAMSTLGLLTTSDAFPPPVFNMGLEIGWTPTIELTVQVRRRPDPGWLQARFVTRTVSEGLLEEDGEIRGEDGSLLALSRQTALVAQPR